ncbi:SH3 domain-containing protein [Thalassobacillus sp. C254]
MDEGTTLAFLEEEEEDNEGRNWYLIETPDSQEGWISSRIVNEKSE